MVGGAFDDDVLVIGSGFGGRVAVPPYAPSVPAGAPGALRLDATADQIIPEYPN